MAGVTAAVASHRPLLSSSTNSMSYPVLNSRPVVILPGLGNNSADYTGLAYSLKDKYKIPSITVQVSRPDWLRNAAGLLDPNYWKGTLRPRPVLDWYLERVDDAVNEARRLYKDGELSLIGHSAGGWLARVYMEEYGKSGISLLLTLGTPHLYIQGIRFFAKSSSNPVTFASSDGFQQITVSTNISEPPSIFFKIRAFLIGLGYKQVCGQAEVWGDGVVPEISAHLEGARNIILEGVYHSPVGSDDIRMPWYGSPVALDKWVHHLKG